IRMRLQRFAQERQLVAKDGRLAQARLAEKAFDADEVAQVKVLSDSPALLADLFLTDHDLHPACPVPNIKENGLTLSAPLDDAPGGFDARPAIFRKVRRKSVNGGNRLVAVEALAPRIEAQFLDAAQLVGSARLKIVGGVGHGGGLSCWRIGGRR